MLLEDLVFSNCYPEISTQLCSKSDCSRHRRQMVVKTKRDGGGGGGGGVLRVPGPLLLLPAFCCVA